MDDNIFDAETKMRQVLGLSDQAKPPCRDDSQRLARQAIRSQAAGREYAERQLARAEQRIQDLQTKFHTVRRERTIAIEAARTAQEAQNQAERGRRAAETALINEKAAAASAYREARETRAIVQDLRIKLVAANQALETLQARIAAEQIVSMPQQEAVREGNDGAEKRKRGRPPGKRDPSVAPKATGKTYPTDQEPVQWWSEGWTPRG